MDEINVLGTIDPRELLGLTADGRSEIVGDELFWAGQNIGKVTRLSDGESFVVTADSGSGVGADLVWSGGFGLFVCLLDGLEEEATKFLGSQEDWGSVLVSHPSLSAILARLVGVLRGVEDSFIFVDSDSWEAYVSGCKLFVNNQWIPLLG